MVLKSMYLSLEVTLQTHVSMIILLVDTVFATIYNNERWVR